MQYLILSLSAMRASLRLKKMAHRANSDREREALTYCACLKQQEAVDLLKCAASVHKSTRCDLAIDFKKTKPTDSVL
jgi:hypothetical protein